MKEKRNQLNKDGFTLIELMIVVVILGLLATIVMPRILDRPEQARRMKAKVDIRHIESALGLFKTDTGVSFNAESIEGGEKIVFRSPFSNGAVLHLKKIEQS